MKEHVLTVYRIDFKAKIKLKTAKQMLKQGLPAKEIIKETGLTLEEIENINSK